MLFNPYVESIPTWRKKILDTQHRAIGLFTSKARCSLCKCKCQWHWQSWMPPIPQQCCKRVQHSAKSCMWRTKICFDKCHHRVCRCLRHQIWHHSQLSLQRYCQLNNHHHPRTRISNMIILTPTLCRVWESIDCVLWLRRTTIQLQPERYLWPAGIQHVQWRIEVCKLGRSSLYRSSKCCVCFQDTFFSILFSKTSIQFLL